MSTAPSPLFPRIMSKNYKFNDPTSSVILNDPESHNTEPTLSGERRLSNISIESCSSASSNGSDSEHKASVKDLLAETNSKLVALFGPVESEYYKALVSLVKEKCPNVKTHQYLKESGFGRFLFFDEASAQVCMNLMKNATLKGRKLSAMSVYEYLDVQEAVETSQTFKSKKETKPPTFIPASSSPITTSFQNQQQVQQQQVQVQVQQQVQQVQHQQVQQQVQQQQGQQTQTFQGNQQEPTATLVIKNLSFGLKQDKLLHFMSNLHTPPQSISYHYDNNGQFRGVAFAKYLSPEQAAESIKELEGKSVGGRVLRVEFKRRGGGGGSGGSANAGGQFGGEGDFLETPQSSPFIPNRQAPGNYGTNFVPSSATTTTVPPPSAPFALVAASSPVSSTSHHISNRDDTEFSVQQQQQDQSPKKIHSNIPQISIKRPSNESNSEFDSPQFNAHHFGGQMPKSYSYSQSPSSSPLINNRQNSNSSNASHGNSKKPPTGPLYYELNSASSSPQLGPSSSPFVLKDGAEFTFINSLPPAPQSTSPSSPSPPSKPPSYSSLTFGIEANSSPVLRAGMEFK